MTNPSLVFASANPCLWTWSASRSSEFVFEVSKIGSTGSLGNKASKSGSDEGRDGGELLILNYTWCWCCNRKVVEASGLGDATQKRAAMKMKSHSPHLSTQCFAKVLAAIFVIVAIWLTHVLHTLPHRRHWLGASSGWTHGHFDHVPNTSNTHLKTRVKPSKSLRRCHIRDASPEHAISCPPTVSALCALPRLWH